MWRKMKGLTPSDDGTNSDVKERGTLLEPAILAWWRSKHPEFETVIEQPYSTLADMPWGAATPDLRAYDEQGRIVLVEAKTAARMDDWGEPGTDEIPVYYLTQCYWQLALEPEAERVFIPVLGPYLEFAEYVVERDEAIQADLIGRAKRFYDSLAIDDPPPLDDHVATFNTVKAMHPDIDAKAQAVIDRELAHEYVNASLDLKAAESRERAAKTAILAAAERAQYIHDDAGTRIARRQPNKYGISLVRVAKTYEKQEQP